MDSDCYNLVAHSVSVAVLLAFIAPRFLARGGVALQRATISTARRRQTPRVILLLAVEIPPVAQDPDARLVVAGSLLRSCHSSRALRLFCSLQDCLNNGIGVCLFDCKDRRRGKKT